VLASIDTTTTAISLKGTGLTSETIHRDGRAAEALAKKQKNIFRFPGHCEDAAVMDRLTPEQRAQVAEAVQKQLTDNQSMLDQIVKAVSVTARSKRTSLRA